MKARAKYILAVIVTIVLGLGSRTNTSLLPDFVAKHFGDALWAAMIYFGIRVWLIRTPLPIAFALCLGFCYVIELSQLYQADWIVHIRNTLIGGLILGKGFLYADLIRYTVGAAAAFALDYTLIATKRPKEPLHI
ncbi:DUF2809 domain-containing protein [Paenibacillus hamazuiensis]|uniref:ribosomal maturation YjgA family protein n=1 Tax=Paenibacillus hamazuiensis TaxID=2936508 RepID=UPI002010622C|nr:DUF2809 domain-containing protein [Paenibacillus hamazuiensis]